MQSYGDVIHGNRKLLVLLVCLTNDKSCVHVFLRYPYVTRMYSHVPVWCRVLVKIVT